MTARLAGRLAWGSLAVYVLLATAGIVLLAQTPRELVPASDEPAPLGGDILLALTVPVFAVVGALVAGRLPRHPVGWLMCAIAVLNGDWFLALGWARVALVGDPGSLPAGEVLAWLSNVANDVPWPLFTLMLLLVRDGRLPSRRWRRAVW